MKLPIPSINGDGPVYVNSKQYQRILIRRLQRQMKNQALTETQIKSLNEVVECIGEKSDNQKVKNTSNSQKYKYKSRHEHALKRERMANGRFAPKSATCSELAGNASVGSSCGRESNVSSNICSKPPDKTRPDI